MRRERCERADVRDEGDISKDYQRGGTKILKLEESSIEVTLPGRFH